LFIQNRKNYAKKDETIQHFCWKITKSASTHVLEKPELMRFFANFVHHEYFVFKILWKPYTYLTQTGAIGNCGSQGCMEELKQHPKEMLFKIEFGESARQMCWVQQIAVLLMWRCL
jgi:hypothetical protein